MKFANFIISSAVVSLGIVESEIVLPAQFVDQEGWFFDGVAAIDGSRQRIKLASKWDSSSCRIMEISPFTCSMYLPREMNEIESLSVNPWSNLLHRTGSVALIRSSRDGNDGTLVLESDTSSFAATCIPNSLMRLNFSAPGREWNNRTGHVRTGDVSTQISGLNIRETFVKQGFEYRKSVLGYIPSENLHHIRSILEDAGAIAHGLKAFSNCTDTFLDSLPVIEIVEDYFGMLSLHPKQYMEFRSDGICAPMLHDSGRMYRAIHQFAFINPLMLRGVNMRTSVKSFWEICEPNFAPVAATEAGISHAPLVPGVAARPLRQGRKRPIPEDVEGVENKLMRTDESANTGEGVSVSAGPGVASTATTTLPSQEERTTLLA